MDNTPSWDNAPSWANWLAQDSDGSWCWYSERPKLTLEWIPNNGDMAFPAGQTTVVEPHRALQERP